MANILASGIADIPHLAAFDELVKRRFAALGAEMVYLVDLVNVAALPALADQFDVLGYKGWALTTTEAERRDLLKQAIELHRYKGTPWAVKEGIKRVGFAEVKIVEGGKILHDGTILLRNGEYKHGGGANWATFRVFIELKDKPAPTGAGVLPIIAMINEYKNVRSLLTQLVFTKYGVNVSVFDGSGQGI